MARKIKSSAFAEAYIKAALWSSTDDEGEPLARAYAASDISAKTLRQMKKDCNAFQRENRRDLAASGLTDTRAGHDFWLTRNRHGAGFWDEKSRGAEADKALDRLTEASHAYGSFDLYVGDDGRIHGG